MGRRGERGEERRGRVGGEGKGRDFHTQKFLQFLPATDNSHSGFTVGPWPLKQGMLGSPDPAGLPSYKWDPI